MEILEKDHEAHGIVLGNFTETANGTIKLIRLGEIQVRDDTGKLHGIAETIEAFLQWHLSEKEDLAVPIILHHRLRG
ncbi:hypothetical protein A9Q96_13595 [Rhodobacterales bacterium 52_120_T64]|nr:hypothetical protein A9Q96_13595 [Rhodobacterales bacterium 52_120_T64]